MTYNGKHICKMISHCISVQILIALLSLNVAEMIANLRMAHLSTDPR